MNIDTFVISNSIRPSKAYTYLIQLLKENNTTSEQRYYIRRLARKYNQTNERLNQLVKIKDSQFRAHILNLLLKELQEYFEQVDVLVDSDPDTNNKRTKKLLNSLSYQVILLEIRQMFASMGIVDQMHENFKVLEKVLH